MYRYMYACTYVRICICIYIYLYTCIYVHIYRFESVPQHAQRHQVRQRAQAREGGVRPPQSHVYLSIYIYVYICMHVHIYTST